MSTLHTAGHPGTGMAPASKFASLPHTKLGRWAMWMAVTFIVMFVLNGLLVGFVIGPSTNAAVIEFSRVYMPFWGVAMMTLGAAAGVVGMVAIIKYREHSWVAWATLLPLAIVLFFIIGEFAVPH